MTRAFYESYVILFSRSPISSQGIMHKEQFFAVNSFLFPCLSAGVVTFLLENKTMRNGTDTEPLAFSFNL